MDVTQFVPCKALETRPRAAPRPRAVPRPRCCGGFWPHAVKSVHDGEDVLGKEWAPVALLGPSVGHCDRSFRVCTKGAETL